MKCWAMVAARGGSKSIPKKNIVNVSGVPLLDYGIKAAISSNVFTRIFCSSDDKEILKHAETLGVELDHRPEYLATDEAKIDEVAMEFLKRKSIELNEKPDILFLIQPTSPFLLPEHIVNLAESFKMHQKANSGSNVSQVSHNNHAYNQRIVHDDGSVEFLFLEQRNKARNKQEKQKLMIFGNLVAARYESLIEGKGFYAEPCFAIEIQPPYNFDLDIASDICIAESLISSKSVNLEHMLFN